MPGYLEIVDHDLRSTQAAPASSSWPRFTYTYEAVCRACGAVVLSRHCDGFYQHQLDCSRHQDRRIAGHFDPHSSDEGFDNEGMNIVPRWSPTPQGKRRRLNPEDEDSEDDLPSPAPSVEAPTRQHGKTGRGEDPLTTHLGGVIDFSLIEQ